MSVETTIAQWESEVAAVSEQQQAFKAVEPLVASLDSLLRFESVSQALRKRALELVAKAENARQTATSVKVKLVEALAAADTRIAEGVKKREKELKAMEAKTTAIEASLNSMKTDASAKSLEETSLKEARDLASNFDALFDRERAKVADLVQTSRQSIGKVTQDARALALQTLEDCKAFEAANSEKLLALQSAQGEGMPLEEAKSAFVQRIAREIDEEVGKLRAEFDEKLTAWPQKIAPQLLEIIESTEEVYKQATGAPVSESESPEEQLKAWNKGMRRLLTHAGGYTMTGLRTIETTSLLPIRTLLDRVKVVNLTDEGLKALETVSALFTPCNAHLTRMQTALDEDFTRLDECVAAATALAAKVANKTNDAVVLHQRLMKEVSDMQLEMTKEHVQRKLQSARKALEDAQEEYNKWQAEQNEDMGISDED